VRSAAALPRVEQRSRDVVDRAGLRKQVELLEHEPDGSQPQLGEVVVAQVVDVLAVDDHGTGGRPIQAPDHVHEGRLARTARSHDGEELPLLDLQIHPAERDRDLVAAQVLPPYAAKADDRVHRDPMP